MFIRSLSDIEKIWTQQHGKETLYQIFFGMLGTHERVGVPPRPFAVAKSITSFWIMTIEARATNPRHVHDDVEQIYLILEGKGTVWVGDEKAKVRRGDAIFLPEKVSHGFRNDSDKPCVILAVGAKVTPGPKLALPRFLDKP